MATINGTSGDDNLVGTGDSDSIFGLEGDDMPGLVAGVFRGDKPPMAAEVISDAIGMPVLANANLSFVATVL